MTPLAIFGQTYGFEVLGIQGISTQSEAGLNRVGELVNLLVERQITAVSVEGSVSDRSMRALLDGISSRIEESHDISRYLIGLLIFLGLLGTFWGLLETVNAVGDTIAGLSGAATDPAVLFEDLKRGLATPLSGMGTAFSSSTVCSWG